MAIDVGALYESHGPMVMRRCAALLRDEHEAADAMQDVFVQLLRHGDRLSDEFPSSLLYRIATNVCLNRIRARRRRPADGEPELLERIAVASTARQSEARAVLDRLLGREAESTATIAVLHLHDQMTLEEVAAEVGMSVSGVRKRLRMLRGRLRELEAI